MNYVTGKVIRELREKKNLTQKDLAEKIKVSDKTISKWETERGLPDIGVLEELASALGIHVADLLVGEYRENDNVSANMKKHTFMYARSVETIEAEYYVTSDDIEVKKLYPEQGISAYFRKRGHGFFYVYCNRHGLYRVRI